MDGVPTKGLNSDPQIPSQLRQRMLNRAATFAEGAQPSPARPLRRRSSLLSDLSDSRHSFRSSTDNLLRGNDSTKLTSVEEAQQRRYLEPDEAPFDDTILEEDEDSITGLEDNADSVPEDSKTKRRVDATISTLAQQEASKSLRRQELMAFAACFIGPLVGAYLLHALRGQLTVTEGLVSDYNLTIFVMVAELRPIARLMKMQEERMFHLQRIVKSDPRELVNTSDAQAIAQRLSELEDRMSGPTTSNDIETTRVAAEVRQSIQTQLDAITRAIRRYEKKSAAQTIQIEARFHEVDARLKDALSLAAAAARTGQRPGIISTVITWMVNLVNNALQIAWDIALYPLRTALAAAVTVKSLFIKDDERQARRRAKGQTSGHSIPNSRMQSKIGR
ncbi:hypothetical protein N0V94_006990 [Neodidymelliopsis sp. IMI 364377]|nr:hypothetical protein N0V94_006990 [Neodidymelliopsis sp. IMI 364377]